jgi:hypothetical protein
MKRYLILRVVIFFGIHSTLNAVEPCRDHYDGILDCPLEGCGGSRTHPVDGKLNEQKNIRTAPEGPAKLMTIEELKEKPNPSTERFSSDNRDRSVLREMGEGEKIMVVGWLLTVRRGVLESCNCKIDLPGEDKYLVRDNHMVLVDPSLRRPTLARSEAHCVAAEFTPRVKLDHQNFGRAKLNPLIDEDWTESDLNPSGKLKVRMTGVLMFDSEHYFGAPLKRENDWEIHPVFKVEYCPEGKTCTGESDENWVDLDSVE